MRAARCISDAPLKCLRGAELPLYATAPLPAYSLTFSSFRVAWCTYTYNSPPSPRGPTLSPVWLLHWNTLALFLSTFAFTCTIGREEEGGVLKVNCFLKVSPPLPPNVLRILKYGRPLEHDIASKHTALYSCPLVIIAGRLSFANVYLNL